MKTKLKGIWKLIAFIAIIILLAIVLLMWPAAGKKVADVLKVPIQKFNDVLLTIVGGGIGLLLISFGVSAIAIPWIGVTLILIGLALLAYSAWPWFFSKSTTSTDSLNKIN